MAEISQGAVAHVYGISGTITDARVQNFSEKEDFKNQAQVLNEDGNEIERRYDDKHLEATIEIVYSATFSRPAIGSKLTYDGVDYIIESIDKKTTAKGFQTLTLSIRKPEYITPV